MENYQNRFMPGTSPSRSPKKPKFATYVISNPKSLFISNTASSGGGIIVDPRTLYRKKKDPISSIKEKHPIENI